MWNAQTAFLEAKYRLLRYDMRGFGKSALPGVGSYAHTKDLKGLLDHLDIPSAAAIIGLSLGGSVALGFALDFPDVARNLILVDSALGGYGWSSKWLGSMNAIVEKAELSSPSEANRMWLAHPLFAPARGQPKVGEQLARMVEEYSGWHWVNQDPLERREPADITQLSRVKPRTLVTRGERDLPDFHSIATILHAKIPDAKASMIRGAGHMVNMEAPKEFNRAVSQFLELDRGRPSQSDEYVATRGKPRGRPALV